MSSKLSIVVPCYNEVLNLPHIFAQFDDLLAKHTDEDIESFWRFYFDGPHPEETIPDELNGIKTINRKIYSLMGKALKAVQQKRKDE